MCGEGGFDWFSFFWLCIACDAKNGDLELGDFLGKCLVGGLVLGRDCEGVGGCSVMGWVLRRLC